MSTTEDSTTVLVGIFQEGSSKSEDSGSYPEEVSAMILVKMMEPAETYLGRKVNDDVVAAPATQCLPASGHQGRGTIAGLSMMRSSTSSQQLQLHMAWKRGQ